MLKLFNGSNEPFTRAVINDRIFSYVEWFEFLQRVAQSKYWREIPLELRCTHIAKETKREFSVNSPDRLLTNDNLFLSRKSFNCSPEISKRNSFEKTKRIEEIVLSSDSSVIAYSDNSSENSVSSDDEYKLHQVDGKQHLSEFLSTFDRYFKSKFRGNSYDKCQQLETFLTGDLLNVYIIAGGRRIKYSQMKEKLLKFYKKQKIGSRTYWKSEFERTTPAVGESLEMYGMKLTELANTAFPKEPERKCPKIASPIPISHTYKDFGKDIGHREVY